MIKHSVFNKVEELEKGETYFIRIVEPPLNVETWLPVEFVGTDTSGQVVILRDDRGRRIVEMRRNLYKKQEKINVKNE